MSHGTPLCPITFVMAPLNITTYIQAKKKFNSIKPVRGRDPKRRPLFNRRNKRMLLVERSGYYAGVYCDHEVVQWWPDGRILLSVTPGSTYGVAWFIWGTTGLHAFPGHNRLWTRSKGPPWKYYALSLTPQVWVNGNITNPPRATKLNYKRSGTKKVRELAQPFFEAAEAILRIKPEWDTTELGWPDGYDSVFADPPDYDVALRTAVRAYGMPQWRTVPGSTQRKMTLTLTPEIFREKVARRLYPVAIRMGAIKQEDITKLKILPAGTLVKEHIHI